MRPFQNGNEVTYKTDNLLYLIVESDDEGRITEYSESFYALMHTLGVQLNISAQWISKKISDIIWDFDMKKFNQDMKHRM